MGWAKAVLGGAVLCLPLCLSAPSQGAPAPGRSLPPVEVDPSTVVVEADLDAAGAAARRAGLRYDREVAPGFHALRSPSSSAAAPGRALGHGVKQAYHPTKSFSATEPTDPLFPAQSHLTQIEAPAAWDTTQGSPAVRIAIIDTGVADHPDLPPISSADRVTFLSHPSAAYDQPPCASGRSAATESAHATHVAGIAAANGGRGPSELGGTGVAWQASLLDVRVLGGCGDGYTDDIASGITWATEHGARIINLSITGESDAAVLAAIRYARSRGSVVVGAAGNATCGSSNVQVPRYPAAHAEVLAVASTNVNDRDPTSCFSVRGLWVDLAAPGNQILSTLPAGLGTGEYAFGTQREPDGSGYGYISGTSMSTPAVAGAAALLFAAIPGITAGEVEARLVRSANPTPATCRDFNGGRLNVADALADRVNAFGYRMVNARGQVATFGFECHLGDPFTQGLVLTRPIVGLASTASKAGYWAVASDGGIFGYGDATFHGSTGGIPLARPVVGMTSTTGGKGYWLVASDGGIFAFGDAPFLGSTGGIPLSQPIVGMASTPSGRGYWLVASDGGIFAFGDARFLGSTGGIPLNRPVVAMQPTRTGQGYWMVASDGGIFAYGDARFLGSTGGLVLNRPIVGMSATPQGGGYWLAASDGGVFSFGEAPFFGSGVGRVTNVVAATG